MLFYLKQVPDELIKRIENQTPDPCPVCDKEIFSNNIPMSCTILICGHILHWDCLAICATANCPICDKVLEQNLFKQSESIRYFKKKKTLKKPKNITLIQELTTDAPNFKIMEEDKNDDTNSFFNLYCKITKAESQNKVSNQELIKCYFLFGKAISEKTRYYKKFYVEHIAQQKVNKELRQQFPDDISWDNLRKTKEKAGKIYKLFSQIGEEKITRVRSISAWDILKLNSNDIQDIIEEILIKDKDISQSSDVTVNSIHNLIT